MLLKGRIPILALFGCLFFFSTNSRGADLAVFCGGKGPITTIGSALKVLNPAVPNTLTVSGTCKENVVILGFNRLTLKGKPGATIEDASGGTGLVVDIEESTGFVLQGLTINGGAVGVFCSLFSSCRLGGNTVQGSGVGIQFVQSRGIFGANTIQNNGIGLVVLESSSVRTFGGLVIQNNQNSGVDLDTGGSFASFGDTIRDNGGNGIELNNHGLLLMLGTSVTGNAGYGVMVLAHSSADFEAGNVITGNGISGVFVRDVSFAEFRLPSTITGNLSGLDAECRPQFPATRGALTNIGGGITNCVEP